MLESGARQVQQVAQRCGFGDPERMRRTFLWLFGAPPSAIEERGRRGASCTAPLMSASAGQRRC